MPGLTGGGVMVAGEADSRKDSRAGLPGARGGRTSGGWRTSMFRHLRGRWGSQRRCGHCRVGRGTQSGFLRMRVRMPRGRPADGAARGVSCAICGAWDGFLSPRLRAAVVAPPPLPSPALGGGEIRAGHSRKVAAHGVGGCGFLAGLTGRRLAGILHGTIAQGQRRRHHGPFTSTQVTALRDLGSPGLSLRKALLVVWG